ncbi:STAS domain-containing protein [Aquirufa lenticrescens]|uniref:STAS domain-containing protein n=1 Tax=Aquirufa lenticrescens TaxID=2696560 RepID=UPI001CAA6CEB|nr:STAS domain-containing protein [Aquirufa lenticrescens]UAJ14980.1 anti-anti-sigma factor [Aquirufa lenticrescens]
MSNVNSFQLEQNESYAVIDWKAEQLSATNSEELENAIRLLFKKDYANIILNLSKTADLDGYGVSAIRKGTKICTNEGGLFVVVTKNEPIAERLDAAKIENLTLLNTVQEGVDAIYLNDLENEFQDEDDTEGESEFGDSYGEDYD